MIKAQSYVVTFVTDGRITIEKIKDRFHAVNRVIDLLNMNDITEVSIRWSNEA